MGPEQRRDMEKGLSGGSQHVPEGPEGYSALPESAAVSSTDPPGILPPAACPPECTRWCTSSWINHLLC